MARDYEVYGVVSHTEDCGHKHKSATSAARCFVKVPGGWVVNRDGYPLTAAEEEAIRGIALGRLRTR